jgi:hypothetical protein
MTPRKVKLLRVSAVLTLFGLGFMVWSILRPTPMPTILAMSLGQLIGTSAFAIYLFVVILDIRRGPSRRVTAPPPMGEPLAEVAAAEPPATAEPPAAAEAPPAAAAPAEAEDA